MRRNIISTVARAAGRRLRFRLGTLLILTPIVGCLAGAWVRNVAKTVALRRSWFHEHSDVLLIHDDERLVAGGDAGRAPSWFRELLGDWDRTYVILGNDAPPSLVREAVAIFPEANIYEYSVGAGREPNSITPRPPSPPDPDPLAY